MRGNLSESSDDSSASYVLSSDSVASSDSTEEGDSNEEILSASSSQGKRKRRRNPLGLEQKRRKSQHLTMKKWKCWSLGFLVRKNPVK